MKNSFFDKLENPGGNMHYETLHIATIEQVQALVVADNKVSYPVFVANTMLVWPLKIAKVSFLRIDDFSL